MRRDPQDTTIDIENGDLTEAEFYRRELKHLKPPGGRVLPGEVECPICTTSAARFLPFGTGQRQNAQCPGCGSLERHRFLWLYLARRTDFFQRRSRVLHMAPEPALTAPFKDRHGRGYVSIDAFDAGAHIRADLKHLPLKSGRFDVIISSHVLEHIENDRPAIQELSRVLNDKGWAIVMVPFHPSRPTHEDPNLRTPAQRKAAFGHPFHYRSYGNDLPDRLAAAGLGAEIVASKKFLTGKERRRWRINRNYLLVCRKSPANSE
ncbi:MAG: methyltransferase domain-containing protein [Deltaproteobacteria bacterium]|nr:methyltransferase domain-containing protein [Deltaproteobacteria bacterium]